MSFLLRLSNKLDWFSKVTGSLISWLTLFMVLLAAFNAISRSVSRWVGVNLASNALIEAQWYLFSLIFLLGAAYGLQQNAHVRVDVMYSRLSEKGKAWINLAGALVFTIPFCLTLLWLCWPSVRDSWSVWEQSPDPDGLARYPIKSFVMVAFVLITLQAFSEIIKNLAIIGEWQANTQPNEVTP